MQAAIAAAHVDRLPVPVFSSECCTREPRSLGPLRFESQGDVESTGRSKLPNSKAQRMSCAAVLHGPGVSGIAAGALLQSPCVCSRPRPQLALAICWDEDHSSGASRCLALALRRGPAALAAPKREGLYHRLRPQRRQKGTKRMSAGLLKHRVVYRRHSSEA